jgi:Transposase IS116/IS110/IS902 family
MRSHERAPFWLPAPEAPTSSLRNLVAGFLQGERSERPDDLGCFPAMDDPNRITKSKAAGALFGPTPRTYQSGEKDVTSGITRAGDEMVRTALYEAANVLLSRITRFSKLKRWGIDVAKRRGSKRAKVALARKTAVILHRMWVDGSTYPWTETQPPEASRQLTSTLPRQPTDAVPCLSCRPCIRRYDQFQHQRNSADIEHALVGYTF